MKVRDLVDLLERVYDAQRDIAEAERMLGHGGAPLTVESKRKDLHDANRRMQNLLNQDVPE